MQVVVGVIDVVHAEGVNVVHVLNRMRTASWNEDEISRFLNTFVKFSSGVEWKFCEIGLEDVYFELLGLPNGIEIDDFVVVKEAPLLFSREKKEPEVSRAAIDVHITLCSICPDK